jgi:hypothetical protein
MTLSREYLTPRDLAMALVSDAIQSFDRHGSQVKAEGDYPAMSLFALDLEKLKPFWELFAKLVKELPQSNFKELFLGAKQASFWDLDKNIDLYEFLRELIHKSDKPEVKKLAHEIIHLWGGERQLAAPDVIFKKIQTLGADEAVLTFQADELLDDKKSLERAKESFDYLNFHLKEWKKSWAMKTEGNEKVWELKLKVPEVTEFHLRPFLAGVSWFKIELKSKGKLVFSDKEQLASTHFMQVSFPETSAYLIQTHTFGAGRNLGLNLNFDSELPLDYSGNYHWQSDHWIMGQDYYRSLNFDRVFKWSELTFN